VYGYDHLDWGAGFMWTLLRMIPLTVYIAVGASATLAGETSAYDLPPVLAMGQSIAIARPLIEEACSSTEEIRYTGAMAAPANEQTQLNCADLMVFGAARRVEFMFNDGVLEFAWILTESSESESLTAGLAGRFGPILYSSDDYKVFSSGTVALRAVPPEILVATRKLMSDITGLGGS